VVVSLVNDFLVVCDEEGWEIGFRCSLNCRDVEQRDALLDMLKDVSLSASA
jgi:hypothetical protein